PLPRSSVSSALDRTRASSMPAAPNSLTTTAVPRPCGVARKRLSNVVLPAPRKPVITVTGTRAPRSRLSLRPKRPAAGEGKGEFMTAAYHVAVRGPAYAVGLAILPVDCCACPG